MGNVFNDEIDLSEQYKKLRNWHDGSLAFNECRQCDYRYVCNSGCRVDAKAYSGKLNGKDPLMVGPIINGKIHGKSLRNFVPFKITYDKETRETIQMGDFIVNKGARFRYEDNFYLCSIKYGNIIEIDYNVAKFLIEKQKILYARLSLSDDPEAKQMCQEIRKSATIMGLPDNVDMNLIFSQMTQMISVMKQQLDIS